MQYIQAIVLVGGTPGRLRTKLDESMCREDCEVFRRRYHRRGRFIFFRLCLEHQGGICSSDVWLMNDQSGTTKTKMFH